MVTGMNSSHQASIWRLGMKNFHTCHQKSRSDGDGLRGFTIETFAKDVFYLRSLSIRKGFDGEEQD